MQAGLKLGFLSNKLFLALDRLFACFLILFLFGINVNAAANQGVTITELNILPAASASVLFTVSPGNIFVGENLTFTLGPAITSTNTIISNVPCEIWIRPPTSPNYVVMTGITTNLGLCVYKTNLSLAQQNLILYTQPITPTMPRPVGTQNSSITPVPGNLISGQAMIGGNTSLTSINGNIGGGDAFGIILYQGSTIFSNSVNYAVSGAITDIGGDYPTDNNNGNNGGNGLGGNNGNNNNGSGSNSSRPPNSNIFDFLPRTGGFVASVGGIIAVIIIILYLASRRQIFDKIDMQRKSGKTNLPKD